MRELSRKGVLTKLEDLDNKYLHKFFLGAKTSKEIELSEVCHPIQRDRNPGPKPYLWPDPKRNSILK